MDYDKIQKNVADHFDSLSDEELNEDFKKHLKKLDALLASKDPNAMMAKEFFGLKEDENEVD